MKTPIAILAAALVATPALAAQTLSLASLSSSGQQGNNSTTSAIVSRDGRFVAFSSFASNLVPGDTNNREDVFVRDLVAGTTTRVSVSSAGAQGDQASKVGAISGDGRFVAFSSDATNLVLPDANGWVTDVYVHDRQTGVTSRVNVSSSGIQANAGFAGRVDLSADGRFVVFESNATNLAGIDANGSTSDIYLHDRATGTTTRESVDSFGVQGAWMSLEPALSADGRWLVFASESGSLVQPSPTAWRQIYRRDLLLGITELASVSIVPLSQGYPGASQNCHTPVVSDDGNLVAFVTPAWDLVPNDVNGGTADVFVRNMVLNLTTLVSATPSGDPGNAGSLLSIALSGNGRYLLFQSQASNLVPGAAGGAAQWFLRDLLAFQTVLVSKTPAGFPGNAASTLTQRCGLSTDGRVAAFVSDAANLVVGDTNANSDAFVRHGEPLVSSVVPPCGPLAGGTSITIDGAGFDLLGAGASTAVSIGGVAATGVSVVSDSTIRCIAPAGAAGAHDVAVTSSFGAGSLAGGFVHTADLLAYGTGTPGCDGTQEIAAVALPVIGAPDFGLLTERAPAGSLGLLLVTDVQDAAGSDPFGIGIALHVDLFLAVEVVALDTTSDAAGHGSCMFAVPSNAALVGTVWYAQTIWAWTSCALPPYGLSSSRGLRFVVS